MMKLNIFPAILTIAIFLLGCNAKTNTESSVAGEEVCSCEFIASSITQVDNEFFEYAKSNPYCPQGYIIKLKKEDKYGNPVYEPYWKYSLMKADWEELKKYVDPYSYNANGPQPKWELIAK
jgi:hypothetical protein